MSDRLSMTAYARRRGCTPRAVRKAIDAGRLSESVKLDGPGGRATIDPDLADREWEDNTDGRKQRPPAVVGAAVRKSKAKSSPKKKRATRKVATKKVAKKKAAAKKATGKKAPASLMTLNQANTAKANYAAETARLGLRKLEGSLLEADAVGRQARDLGAKMKQKIENLPARLSAQIAANCEGIDQHAVAVLLEGGIREALEDLAVYVADFGRKES